MGTLDYYCFLSKFLHPIGCDKDCTKMTICGRTKRYTCLRLSHAMMLMAAARRPRMRSMGKVPVSRNTAAAPTCKLHSNGSSNEFSSTHAFFSVLKPIGMIAQRLLSRTLKAT
eukprot:1158289-Pelagomonas_calceolata.AAC.4